MGYTRQEQDGGCGDRGIRKIVTTRRTKPLRLQTDAGKEFYNAPFRRMLEKEGIHHFSTPGDAKASVVERLRVTSQLLQGLT